MPAAIPTSRGGWFASPELMSRDALPTYLNDHLAGSVTAVELLDRLIEQVDGDVRTRVVELRSEIAADQQTLEDILHQVGGHESGVRALAGWLAEKAGQLKLLFDDPQRGKLGRLEALEILRLGVHGKRGLWTALRAVQPQIPELHGVDFERLEQRAVAQHAQVEELRVESARRVLGRHHSPN